MKSLVFVTSFPSPHVMPLMEALQRHYTVTGCIQMMEMSQERKSMGYDTASSVEVISFSRETVRCKKMILDADVLIMACGNFEVLQERIAANKEIYIMHERLFKKGLLKLLDPRLQKYRKICKQAHGGKIYLLPIGVSSARDFAFLGFPEDKMYKFAYFPAVEPFEPVPRQRETTEILWVGRMIRVKRPMMAIRLARFLPSDCKLTMVGSGKQMNQIKKYADKHRLQVSLPGQLDNAEVRRLMRDSDILLSTSGRGEGWGAVINEGMNYGCAVVCSDSIGCYRTLVDEENACIFKTGSLRSLVLAVRKAGSNLDHYRRASLKKISDEMNPEEAARRFSVLQNKISAGEDPQVFGTGICSKAK